MAYEPDQYCNLQVTTSDFVIDVNESLIMSWYYEIGSGIFTEIAAASILEVI